VDDDAVEQMLDRPDVAAPALEQVQLDVLLDEEVLGERTAHGARGPGDEDSCRHG
jgi:hypothetical protein